MRRYFFFLGILFFTFIYLGLQLTSGFGAWVWVGLIYAYAGILLYPSRWLRKSEMGFFQHLLRWKVYMDMGFLCFLFSFVLLRDLLLRPFTWWQPQWHNVFFGTSGDLAVLGLTGLALSLGVWTAQTGPRIKKIKIPIKDLPESLVGFRIAQISDLHVGPTIGTKYVQKVVRKVNSLLPHMTVLTGDIVDDEADHHLEAVSHLKQLEPLGQIMYVTGNHEYYWNGPRWIKEFRALGHHVLENSQKIIQYENHNILIAGVLDPAAALANPRHKPDIGLALKNNSGDKRSSAAVKILLAHQPNIADEAAAAGFDLLLSGHTHAGQFFPFTLLIFSVQKFVKGLKACGDMWVYVNQGTGYWGPPIRLGTFTEITLLELTAKTPQVS